MAFALLSRGLNRHLEPRDLRVTRVLFIAYYFPPVGGAGVQRAQKFVRYLPEEGFLPIVLSGPEAAAVSRWTPHDPTLTADLPSKVPVYRVDKPVPAPGSRLRRSLEVWLGRTSSFARWWIRSAATLGRKAAETEKPSLIFATMSPFESAVVARDLARRYGVPWVADLRDPWALDEMQVYPTLLHRKIALARMGRLLSGAALIVMNTPEAASVLKKTLLCVREKRVAVITNGFDREDFAEPVAPRSHATFRIVHSGYLHTELGVQMRRRRFFRLLGGAEPGVDILTRSHAVLLEAIELWISRRPEVCRQVEIVFAGEVSAADRALAERSKAGGLVRFLGYVSHAQSVRLIRSADLLFLPMHNLPFGKRSRIVPGKTYEYMAADRPILAAVPEGDARDFLCRSGTGLVCRPDDAAEMARILERVYQAWREGKRITCADYGFIRQFERKNQAQVLANEFRRLLAAPTLGSGQECAYRRAFQQRS